MRYKQCRFRGRRDYLHRKIWIEAKGEIPEGMEIDHIDGDKLNNDLSNLRLVTKSQNQHNKPAKGYVRHIPTGTYQSKIRVNGRIKSLGYYKTKEEARSAYLEAKKIHHTSVPEEYYERV